MPTVDSSARLQEIGSARGRYLSYEDRVHQLLRECETKVDTTIEEAGDEQASQPRGAVRL